MKVLCKRHKRLRSVPSVRINRTNFHSFFAKHRFFAKFCEIRFFREIKHNRNHKSDSASFNLNTYNNLCGNGMMTDRRTL
jgi:hypothetical protein